jgi:hypothetical protein
VPELPDRASTARARTRNPPCFLRHAPGFERFAAIQESQRLIHFCSVMLA